MRNRTRTESIWRFLLADATPLDVAAAVAIGVVLALVCYPHL